MGESTKGHTRWGLPLFFQIDKGHILCLHGIPSSDSKKKIAFVHVINNNAFGPGNHEARLQKIYNTISSCWELPADNGARFMCLLFP